MGDKLRNLRGSKSVKEVCFACGISETALNAYENNERVPRDEVKLRLANYYGVKITDLF